MLATQNGLSRRLTDLWDFPVPSFFGEASFSPSRGSVLNRASRMKSDLRDEGDQYVLDIDVPGITKGDLDLSIKDRFLQVSVVQKQEDNQNKNEYHWRERRVESMQRSFELPNGADAEKINAALNNGVLTVTIGKIEKVKLQKIRIN